MSPATIATSAQAFDSVEAVASEGDVQSRVVAYCRVQNDDCSLRSGMTGFGRIYREPQFLAMIVSTRALRVLRTEFWW